MSDSKRLPIRVMIVDDHPVVRNGLIGMFEGEVGFEVVGDAGDGAEAVRRAGALAPDVILMDLRMPEMDGVAAISALAAAGSRARVLVLTTYDTDSDVLSAIEAGATGYLLKDAPPAELFRAVRSAASGEAVLSPSVATRVVGQMRGSVAPAAQEPISARELEGIGVGRAGRLEPGRRCPVVHLGGDGQDPPDAHLREARRQRPSGRGRPGV
jgi:DNA-binding NarL/FixJ family response regulator